jgi:hypothetical protein
MPSAARRAVLVVLLLVSFGGVAARAQRAASDALARARRFYNEQKLDAAIQAALEARRTPALANAAAVVLARAYLERFTQVGQTSDLADARDVLKQVNEAALSPSERVEFLVGLGQSFYLEGCLDGCYAAAAEQFEQALVRADDVDYATRELLLEWWAVTLDKLAQIRPAASRPLVYARVLERAQAEVARSEVSAVGLYWLAAAARGVGDLERAWGAALSGWARARFLGDRGALLRSDLDRFVTLVLLPDIARELAAGGDAKAALTSLEGQWAEWKAKWK